MYEDNYQVPYDSVAEILLDLDFKLGGVKVNGKPLPFG